jgi:hypothetical protein
MEKSRLTAAFINKVGRMEILDFLKNNAKEIISITTPFVILFINKKFQPKAKLLWASKHLFTFLVPEPLINQNNGEVISPNQTVHTNSITVTNIGDETAHKVEIVFNWKPQYFNLWPARHYDQRTEHDNRYTIMLESLAPKESIGFELLSFNLDLPQLVTVRSNESVSENVYMVPQPVYPRWKILTVQSLILAGSCTAIYAIISIIQFFAQINSQ